MKKVGFLVSFFALAALAAMASPAQAGSCHEPVSRVVWKGTVSTSVNVRDLTCMDSNIVGSISTGQRVDIVGITADGWYQVEFVDGRKGFVWNTFLTVTQKDFTSEEAETTKEESHKKDVVKETTKTEVKEVTKTKNADLTDRLKGRILLQVENNGEAWYVHPDDGARYYMKDGDTAYLMMRDFGLGASNVDIDALLNGDKNLADRVKGKILLAVERNGEAYYVHPEKLTVHYLQDGKEAYRIMRELSLGITNSDLEQITALDFETRKEIKTIAKKTTETPTTKEEKKTIVDDKPLEIIGSIGLTANISDGAVHLSWTVNQTNTSKGFKIVYGRNSNPEFGVNESVYLPEEKARKHALKIASDGDAFHFRVCQYTGEGCGVYSNDVELFIPENDGGAVVIGGQIILEGEVVNDRIELTWENIEVDSSLGWKVVYDVFSNPTYPEDNPVYISNPSAFEFVKVNMPAGTYYFRICQYTGEGCGVYSNEIVLTVQGITTSGIFPSPYQQGAVPAGLDFVALNKYWQQKVNALRDPSELRILNLDQRWINTATEWATYMGDKDSATHTRSDGSTMHQWINTKGFEYTVRHSEEGWNDNYFTENISWGIASDGTTAALKVLLDDAMSFFLSEGPGGAHYDTIYHADWNTVGVGFHLTPMGDGKYKVYIAYHYGSLAQE